MYSIWWCVRDLFSHGGPWLGFPCANPEVGGRIKLPGYSPTGWTRRCDRSRLVLSWACSPIIGRTFAPKSAFAWKPSSSCGGAWWYSTQVIVRIVCDLGSGILLVMDGEWRLSVSRVGSDGISWWRRRDSIEMWRSLCRLRSSMRVIKEGKVLINIVM